MAKEQKISRRLRGLNVGRVDDYINQLNKQHTDEVAVLKQKAELCHGEKERLYQLLMERQLEKERLNKSKELLNLALVRAKESVAFFQGKAKEEADDLLRYARQQNESYEWKLQSIEQEINLTKKHVEALLAEMTKLFQESKTEKDQQHEEAAPNKLAGKIFPAIALKKNYIKLNELRTETVAPESVSNVEKTEENEWKADEKKMTADGMVVDNSGENFWDESPAKTETIMPRANTAFTVPVQLAEEIKAGINEAALTSEKKEAEMPKYQMPIPPAAGDHKSPAVHARTGSTDESFGRSPAISAEINNIRHKYIVGKIAGESLMASDGSIIVAQNQIITAEIVAWAESEGKLPELIVSMILPGMEA